MYAIMFKYEDSLTGDFYVKDYILSTLTPRRGDVRSNCVEIMFDPSTIIKYDRYVHDRMPTISTHKDLYNHILEKHNGPAKYFIDIFMFKPKANKTQNYIVYLYNESNNNIGTYITNIEPNLDMELNLDTEEELDMMTTNIREIKYDIDETIKFEDLIIENGVPNYDNLGSLHIIQTDEALSNYLFKIRQLYYYPQINIIYKNLEMPKKEFKNRIKRFTPFTITI
jgi:hypothetical protein